MKSTILHIHDQVARDSLRAKIVAKLEISAGSASTATGCISNSAVGDVGVAVERPRLSEGHSGNCDSNGHQLSAVKTIPRFWVIALGARGLPDASIILSAPFYGGECFLTHHNEANSLVH